MEQNPCKIERGSYRIEQILYRRLPAFSVTYVKEKRAMKRKRFIRRKRLSILKANTVRRNRVLSIWQIGGEAMS